MGIAAQKCVAIFSIGFLLQKMLKYFQDDQKGLDDFMANYDVFISFKHTNHDGKHTPDYFMAQELYDALQSRKIDTFFSSASLEIVGISQYKKAIDEALDLCKVLIVVGTSQENINSKWVNYEWDGFYNDILSGMKTDAKVFSYIDQITTNQLPRTLRQLQVFEKREIELHEICNYIEHALGKTQSKTPQTIQPVFSSETRFIVIEGQQVGVEDINQALNLDKIVYQDDYIISIEKCIAWYQRNSQIYTMLKDTLTNQIIAYINVSPISDEYYERIKDGDFVDTLLPPEAIMQYDLPYFYSIYFSSIVIHPDYQNTGVLKPLFDALVEKFIRLGNNDILMKRLIADAVTEKGVKVCELFGMEKIKSSKHHSQIYETQFLPPKFRVTSKATNELYKFYEQKAEELDFIIDLEI